MAQGHQPEHEAEPHLEQADIDGAGPTLPGGHGKVGEQPGRHDDKRQADEEAEQQADHGIALVAGIEDPVAGPDQGRHQCQRHPERAVELQAEHIPLGGDHQGAEVTQHYGDPVAAAQLLAEEGDGQQTEGDGPGVVEGLCLLGGQQIIGLEQQQVVEEGIQHPQRQIVEGTLLDIAPQQRQLALFGNDSAESQGRGQGRHEQQLHRLEVGEGDLEGGGHRRPEGDGAESILIGFFLIFEHRGRSADRGKGAVYQPVCNIVVTGLR
ncbi:hypothetical protein D3C79_758380 [compost metagenome]